MTRAPHTLLLLLLWLATSLVVACSDAPATTPRAALESLRSALSDRDGARLVELHDPESLAFYRAQVREARARLARGDSLSDIFPDGGRTAEHFTEGTEDEALARYVLFSSEIASRADWIATAAVVAEEADDDTHVRLRLRGADEAPGEERELCFVRTADGWKHDAFRQYRRTR